MATKTRIQLTSKAKVNVSVQLCACASRWRQNKRKCAAKTALCNVFSVAVNLCAHYLD